MKHELKTWPIYFNEIGPAKKNFEYRINDRDFKVKDTLILKEYDPETKTYSGNEKTAEIGYILVIGEYAILGLTITQDRTIVEIRHSDQPFAELHLQPGEKRLDIIYRGKTFSEDETRIFGKPEKE